MRARAHSQDAEPQSPLGKRFLLPRGHRRCATSMPQQRDLLLFAPSSADYQTGSTTSSNHEAHPLLAKNTTKAEKEEAKPPDGAHPETTTPPQTRHRINHLGSMKKAGKDVGAETKPETKVHLDKEEFHSNDDDDDKAISDFVASLEAKKPSRHRYGASLMNALGIIKSDTAGAAAPKTKVDQEEESLSNDEAITDDDFLETKKPPPSRHRRIGSWINPLGSMKNDAAAAAETEPKDDDKESLSPDQFDHTHPWPEADRNETPFGDDDVCGQQPFPTAPRLMDSFRLEQLHRESASHQDVHWFVGMLYAWLRYWYSGWTRLRQSLPTWSWPLIVLLALFQPVVTLLVLPVAVVSFHYGQRLVLASASVVGLPTPTKAARLWLWARNALRDRWNRWRVGMEQGRIVLFLVGMVLHFVRPAPNPPRRQHRR